MRSAISASGSCEAFFLVPPLGILPRQVFNEEIKFGALFFAGGVLGALAAVTLVALLPLDLLWWRLLGWF